MPNYIFGNIPGVNEGDSFVNREALRNAEIHLAPVAGIDGNPRVGATSIVLNGGYVDDLDLGDEIIYTGHGGNDANTNTQISDQSWDATGNKALLVSEMHGLPVRVTRGHKHKSPFSPSSGYEYGGLYSVVEHFQDRGVNGFLICRYRLIKQTPLPAKKMDIKKQLPKGNDEIKRTPTTILKIVRDTILSQSIKQHYDYTCQVCEIRISVREIGYAEAAHIRPLGLPHNGSDKPENIICLCPNHHVMFDKGIFTIADDFKLIGLNGSLIVKDGHNIDLNNLAYHRDNIYNQ